MLRASRGVVKCGRIRSPYYQLRDSVSWERFDVGQLPVYFKENLDQFQDCLDELADSSAILNSQQEKELYFMLESLIQTKRFLQDRVDSKQATAR